MDKKAYTGTISRIERQKKRAERISIFIDDEFAFGLSEEACLKFSLFPGRELSLEDIAMVREWDEGYQARQTGMRYLERRRRSTAEVRSKLREKEFSEESVSSALAFLEEYGLIDDQEFARAWIHDRLLRKRLGRGKLRAELISKGIAKGIIETVLADEFDNERVAELVMLAAREKDRRLRKPDLKARERSMVTFLMGRGFTWEEIRPTIDLLREEWRTADNE